MRWDEEFAYLSCFVERHTTVLNCINIIYTQRFFVQFISNVRKKTHSLHRLYVLLIMGLQINEGNNSFCTCFFILSYCLG